MNRRISDLLDHCSGACFDMETDTPLSARRIRARTLAQIDAAPARRARGRMRPLRLLAAAAVVAALTLSAMAVGHALGAGELFRSYFSAAGGEDLSPEQVAVLDQVGSTFEGGVTSGGTTITPVAALADENVYYLRLRIEAPEGVTLPDLDPDTDGYYQLFGSTSDSDITLTPAEGAYQSFGWGLSQEWLPDNDPTDNRKEVVLRYTRAGEFRFNDGVSKVLTIRGLWIQSPDKEYTQILEGEFSFDIGIHYESTVLTLDCGGAYYTDPTYGYTNILEELELSPLSFSYRFRSTMPENDWVIPGLGDLRIVMKDGTNFLPAVVVPEKPLFEIPLSDTPVSVHESFDVFDTPLDLEQVDYVQYGETRIPVAQID